MKLTRNVKLAVGATSAIALALLVKLTLFSPSIQDRGLQLKRCIDSGDAPCVISFMRPAEKTALHMDEFHMKKLLAEYVWPRMIGREVSDEHRATEYQPGLLGVSFTFRKNDGSTFTAPITIAETDEGVKAPNLILQLVSICCAINSRNYFEGASEGINGVISRYDNLGKDQDLLKRCGIAALYNEQSFGLMSLTEFRAHCLDQLEHNHLDPAATLAKAGVSQQ